MKFYFDRIWIYEDGKEVAKFLKKANEPLKYYNNRTPDGVYMGVAELRSDGYWYDRYGDVMEYNPLTNEPQAGYIKADVFLGESLTNPSFPKAYDIQAFAKWAKDMGLPAPVIEDGAVKFYDYNNLLVRYIKELKTQKGKIQDDYVFIYDANKILVGKYAKHYISDDVLYHYGRNTDGRFRYIAQMRKDGFWHPFGQDWDKILPNNPVTGEPQNPPKTDI